MRSITPSQPKRSRASSRPATPSRSRSSGSPSSRSTAARKAGASRGGHEQSRLAVGDQVEQRAAGGRDHRPAECHRLGRREAEAFPLAGRDEDGRPLEEPLHLTVRHGSERVWDAVAQRPVARDDEVQVGDRLDEGVDVLLRREPADVEHLGRLDGWPHLVGDPHPVGDHDGVETRRAHRRREGLGDADHGGGRTQQRAHEPRALACQLLVREAPGGARAVQRDDPRPPREASDRRRQQPVRVDEIGIGHYSNQDALYRSMNPNTNTGDVVSHTLNTWSCNMITQTVRWAP